MTINERIDTAIEIVRDLAPEAVARHEQCCALTEVALSDPKLPAHERTRLVAKRAASAAALEELAAAIAAQDPVH